MEDVWWLIKRDKQGALNEVEDENQHHLLISNEHGVPSQ